MNPAVSLQDVANIVTFIAPGYFAIQVYSLIYAKKDRDFSRLLVESIVYSLPLVTFVNIIWQNLIGLAIPSSVNVEYALLLLVVAVLAGGLTTVLRNHWPIQPIASRLGLGSPDDDFIKTQLGRIDNKNPNKNPVTITLKSGAVFSGTIDQLSRYTPDGPVYYYFTYLAWFNEATNGWDERDGGIIVERSEIEYIETPKLSNKR